MLSDSDLEQTWAELQTQLRRIVPETVYRIWLEPLTAVAGSQDVLYLQAPRETRDWIARRFGASLTSALVATGRPLRRVELLSEGTQPPGQPGSPAPAGYEESRRPRRRRPPPQRFDDFVIGASNRFAHAACLAVAELPGQAYNPLFLYGPPGVGKTHLLGAIGSYITSHDHQLAVRYATGEAFTGDFTQAVRLRELDSFKRHYRDADVLLIDDVQFVESKEKTAEELFHTLEAAFAQGAQVVLTGDRPPSRMPALHTRLRERLEAGLVVDLETPDFQTRLSIVSKRAGDETGPEQRAALELLAQEVSSSVRALEGALIRVRAYASLTQQPLTPRLVEHVLDNLYASDSPRGRSAGTPSTDRIQELSAHAFGISSADLLSPRRSRQVVYARQVAMYLCRELTSLSLPAIGQRFGGRDHTTVLHAHRQIRERLLADRSTRELVENLVVQLNATSSTGSS